MDRMAKHIIFKGQVQGVGFRYTSYNIARRYDITGFVRNLPDRTVEMLVQGPTQDVDNCIACIEDCFSGHIRDKEMATVPCNPTYTDFCITG